MTQTLAFWLIDGFTDKLVCVYDAKAIAVRDCAKMNAMFGDQRYYVKNPKGRRVTA